MRKSRRWKIVFKRGNLYAGMALHALLTFGLIVIVITLWIRGSGTQAETKAITDARALAILRNLKDELQNGAAERMQNLFPEGACFINTLYGLAWCNLAVEPSLRDQALPEIRSAIRGQESPAAIDPFRWDTSVRRGAFWLGQRNLLLARYLELEPQIEDTVTSLANEFHQNSHEYYRAIMDAPQHQLESYSGMCWPADVPMGLASLVIHDRMYETTFSEAMKTWTDYHDAHGWNRTMLPVGRINAEMGFPIEPARGCANSLIVTVLAGANPEYAARYYKEYQKYFEMARCGFAMFREYPADYKGAADVDSGPIIMGAGVTATGLGLAAARAVGDTDTEIDIRELSEMFGLPQMRRNLKGEPTLRYLFGVLPVADAFLAWSWSVPRAAQPLGDFISAPGSRWVFHGIVLATLGLLIGQWMLFFRIGRKRLKRVSRMGE